MREIIFKSNVYMYLLFAKLPEVRCNLNFVVLKYLHYSMKVGKIRIPLIIAGTFEIN